MAGGSIGGLATVNVVYNSASATTSVMVTFPSAGPVPTMTVNTQGLNTPPPPPPPPPPGPPPPPPQVTAGVATSNAGTIQTVMFPGTVNGGNFTLGIGALTTAPIQWSSNQATLTGNIQAALNALDDWTLNGPMSGKIIVGGSVSSPLTFSGPVTGIVGIGGNINATTQIQGALSGEMIVLGGISSTGSVQINGPIRNGGVLAIQGNITGSLGVNGPIDSKSALVLGGSAGAVSLNGPVQGILAAVGSVTYAGGKTPNSKGAVFNVSSLGTNGTGFTTTSSSVSATQTSSNGAAINATFTTLLDNNLASLLKKTLTVIAPGGLLSFSLTTPSALPVNNAGVAVDGGVAYTPAQVRGAYGINNLSYDGTGQTIAFVEAYDDPNILQAMDAFDSQFGLMTGGPTLYDQYGASSSFLTVVGQDGTTADLPASDPTGGWETEEELDVEWAHAMAPGAQIVVVEANSQSLADLMASVATAANQPGVSVVSMSWGFPEGQAVLSADEALYDGDFTTPAGHTPVTFVASTGDYGTADPEYPSFSPNVVAVGGTSLFLNADNSYNNETGWGYFSDQVGAFIGSGGGVSLYEPQPAYQAGVQTTGLRTTPDVSFVADPGTGAWIADSYNLPADNPWEVVGGTSLSAPAWAGLLALVDQGRVAAGESTLSSNGGTEAQQALYGLSAADFNSITSGTNGGYTAAAGYNMVTGLGTPVANLLVPDLIAYQGTSAPNATASASGGFGSANGSSTINVVFNVFDALTGTRSGQADLLGGEGGGTLIRGLSTPAVPRAEAITVVADHSAAAPQAQNGLGLFLTGPVAPAGAVAEAAAMPGPVTVGSFAATAPAFSPAALAPALPGVSPVDISVLPAMPTGPAWVGDAGTDLLGGEGQDLLLGDGGDLLVGGFAGNGAQAASRPAAPATAAAPSAYAAALDAFLARGWGSADGTTFEQTFGNQGGAATVSDAAIGDDYFLSEGNGDDGSGDEGADVGPSD